MFSRIDTFLLNRVYQPIVDRAQKTPLWCARQAAWTLLLATLLKYLFQTEPVVSDWVDALSVFANIFVCSFALLVTSSDFNINNIRTDSWRLWGFVATVMFWPGYLFAMAMGEFSLTPVRAAINLGNLAWLSLVYFAACNPPAPPKRKTSPKLTLNGQ